MKRRVPTLAAICLLGLAAPTVAGGPDHFVDASPTGDGTAIHRADVEVTKTGSKTVDATNVAQAHPHDGPGWGGIAVAFQAVIVKHSPDTVEPRNIAAAVNSDCTSC